MLTVACHGENLNVKLVILLFRIGSVQDFHTEARWPKRMIMIAFPVSRNAHSERHLA